MVVDNKEFDILFSSTGEVLRKTFEGFKTKESEEVDIYKEGKIVAHEGTWIHGTNNARAGMMMPGEPIIGARYYQEVAPKVAMDRARIVDLSTTLKTPAGEFKGCLKVQEENPLDNEKEFKIHAPGIGLVQDENLLLVKYGFVNK